MALDQRNSRNRREAKQKVDVSYEEAPVADVVMQEGTTGHAGGYCWTHGFSRNRRHTSMSCKNKHADHQDAATPTNKMGGSTEVNSGVPTPRIIDDIDIDDIDIDDSIPRGYCWTHGSSQNISHTSMTCNRKQTNHQDEATVTNKMGGSTKVVSRSE
jgi:hypothetical protein